MDKFPNFPNEPNKTIVPPSDPVYKDTNFIPDKSAPPIQQVGFSVGQIGLILGILIIMFLIYWFVIRKSNK